MCGEHIVRLSGLLVKDDLPSSAFLRKTVRFHVTLKGLSPLVAHVYAMQYRISASTRIQCLQLHFDNGVRPRSLWFCIRG